MSKVTAKTSQLCKTSQTEFYAFKSLYEEDAREVARISDDLAAATQTLNDALAAAAKSEKSSVREAAQADMDKAR
jgi:hypothetical protein